MKGQLKLFFEKLDREKQKLTQQYERANATLQNELEQFEQLQKYEENYNASIDSQLGYQDALSLSRFRDFYHKLGELLSTQEQKVNLARQHVGNIAQALYRHQKKMDLLVDLARRKHLALEAMDEKRLQKEIDDMVARKYSVGTSD